MLLGVIPLVMLGAGPVSFGHLTFDYHYMIVRSLLTILGFQVVINRVCSLRLIAKRAAVRCGSGLLETLRRHFNLERGLVVG
jgi:hypothetical protein